MFVLFAFVFVFVFAVYYYYTVQKHKNEIPLCTNCKKQFQQSPEYRCSTKCFDCVNNNKSLNHLNISYGNANIYAV